MLLRACFLVPIKRIFPPSAAALRTKVIASSSQANGLTEVDYVDAVGLTPQVGGHLGFHPTGLVAEMETCVDQIFHGG